MLTALVVCDITREIYDMNSSALPAACLIVPVLHPLYVCMLQLQPAILDGLPLVI